MPTIDWKLERIATGELKTLEGWQVRGAVRTLVNGGRDSLSLNFSGNDLLGNSPFVAGEILRLDRVVEGVTTTVFRGRVVGLIRGAYGSSEGFAVQVAGPWWYLENLVFMRTAEFVADPAANPSPAVGSTQLIGSDFVTVEKTTSVIFLKEDEFGSTIDSKEQLVAAIDYAIAKGAPIALGTIDDGIDVPRDSASDITCAELILRSLRWTPDQVVFFDYSVDPPTINVRTSANRTALAIDIEDEEIAEVEVNPRNDLAVAGVTINYLRRHQRTGMEFLTLDKDTAGPDPEGIGALVLTLELYGSYLVGTFLVAAESLPVGLAASLFDAYSAIPYEGRILLVQEECSAIPWTSRKLAIANGVPEWESATILVQQSSEDIFRGRTELTIGPPRQLGAQDLLGLVRKGRTKAPTIAEGYGPTTPHQSDNFPAPNTTDPKAIFSINNQPTVILAFVNYTTSPGFVTCDDCEIYEAGVLSEIISLILVPLSLLTIGGTSSYRGIIFGRGADRVDTMAPPFKNPGKRFRVHVEHPKVAVEIPVTTFWPP
jgi:hypothetical protein